MGTSNVTIFFKQETVICLLTKKQVFSLPIQGKFYPKCSSYRKRVFINITVLFEVIIRDLPIPCVT